MTLAWLKVSSLRVIAGSISSAAELYEPPSKALAQVEWRRLLHAKTSMILSSVSLDAQVAPMEISTEWQKEFELKHLTWKRAG